MKRAWLASPVILTAVLTLPACSGPVTTSGATSTPTLLRTPIVAGATPTTGPTAFVPVPGQIGPSATRTQLQPSVVLSASATPRQSVPASLTGATFTLLASNHLVAVDHSTGRILADRSLAPSPQAKQEAGQFLAFSMDQQRLFVLVPGPPDQVAAIDVTTGATEGVLCGKVIHALNCGQAASR